MPPRTRRRRTRTPPHLITISIFAAAPVSPVFAAGIRAGSAPVVPSEHDGGAVPVLAPVNVRTEELKLSPEQLVVASMPWEGMDKPEAQRRGVFPRQNPWDSPSDSTLHRPFGHQALIPPRPPPFIPGDVDVTHEQQGKERYMDQWIRQSVTPSLPAMGPAYYARDMKPENYYLNPLVKHSPFYSPISLRFLQTGARTAVAATHGREETRRTWGAASRRRRTTTTTTTATAERRDLPAGSFGGGAMGAATPYLPDSPSYYGGGALSEHAPFPGIGGGVGGGAPDGYYGSNNAAPYQAGTPRRVALLDPAAASTTQAWPPWPTNQRTAKFMAAHAFAQTGVVDESPEATLLTGGDPAAAQAEDARQAGLRGAWPRGTGDVMGLTPGQGDNRGSKQLPGTRRRR